MPPYLTTAELAALCRTSPETVRFWRYVGKGPQWFKVGRKVLYEATVVDEWLRDAQQDCEKRSGPEAA